MKGITGSRSAGGILLLTDHDDRACCVLGTSLADGPQHRPGEAADSPTADDEKFGPFGGLDQRLRRVALDKVFLQPWRLPARKDGAQLLREPLPRLLQIEVRVDRRSAPAPGGRRVPDIDRLHGTADHPCVMHRPPQRGTGGRRSVHAHDHPWNKFRGLHGDLTQQGLPVLHVARTGASEEGPTGPGRAIGAGSGSGRSAHDVPGGMGEPGSDGKPSQAVEDVMHGSVYTVSDVMTRTVVALAAGATFKEIVRTVEGQRISALPVVDTRKRVIGVVSEADLLRKEEFRDSAPDRGPRARPPEGLEKAQAITAADLMTFPAVTVHPGATLAQAARLMARHKIKRLPVVDDDGVLRGIVSRSDLLRVFLRPDHDIAEEIRHEVLAGRLPDGIDSVRVEVNEGVVTLTGRVPDTSVVPLAVRLVRSVEGVVDVRPELTGPPHRPALEPDLAQEEEGRRSTPQPRA